jgi:hypothetical protein
MCRSGVGASYGNYLGIFLQAGSLDEIVQTKNNTKLQRIFETDIL